MPSRPKVIVVFGAGKLGGGVVDFLATRFPQHKYVLVGRSAERVERRVNLARYICSQWDAYPELSWEKADLIDVERTAEVIAQHKPDVVFNATTPFPWWLIDNMPEKISKLAHSAGPGIWCALDCVLPMKLSDALALAQVPAIYINGCYPDLVNAFLAGAVGAPALGIGNVGNIAPGVLLAYAKTLAQDPRLLEMHLICHHYISHNAYTIGGSGGAPYYLSIKHSGGREVFEGTNDAPFALLKSNFRRTSGVDGQSLAVSSSASVLSSFLNSHAGRHHAPGPKGLPGGYPIIIDEHGNVTVDVPEGLDLKAAAEINCIAQTFDGIESVSGGRIAITGRAQEAMHAISGMNLPVVTRENAVVLSREIVGRLNRRYGLELGL
jgi:hypothetical protein